ncbi:MAG TPA: hypothetical protein VFP96_01430 [Candidatus Acidoferrum sp.]|jgi:hypothetical protein|nr:hypothetical protein [Candidatus Acidoferrum sp.]
MREARSGNGRHKTLRAQGDVSHTFGSLLIPLAIILTGWGGFQLNRALANPLESDAAVILFASVILVCGLLLAAYLLREFRVARTRAETERLEMQAALTLDTAHRTRVVCRAPPPPRPFHRHYVDDARISR